MTRSLPVAGPAFIDNEALARLMDADDYLQAVEAAFRAHADGRTSQPMPLHIALEGGGVHAKGAYVGLDRGYVAVKVNANFPGNPARGLPTIQGAVLLHSAEDGRLLAILDSREITAKRTAAASALAARYLAREDARAMAICGCGEQGRAQLAAIARVRPIERATAWDIDAARASAFAAEMSEALQFPVRAAGLADAIRDADIVVTATSASQPFLGPDLVRPGVFIAAVGADSPHKSELHAELFPNAKVVVDSLDQAVAMGDLHHAVAQGKASRESIHAELAEVVVGRKPGRTDAREVTIFDSTGMAIQDVASAALAHSRLAGTPGRGPRESR